MNVQWSDVEKNRVAELLRDGYTRDQIAEIISVEFRPVTRSAVASVVSRNSHLAKLGAHKTPIRTARRNLPSRKPVSETREAAAPAGQEGQSVGLVPTLNVPYVGMGFLFAAERGRCLHSVGGDSDLPGPDMLVCGQTVDRSTQPSNRWCAHHRQTVYR